MRRFFPLFLLFFLSIIACESRADKIITESETVGSVPLDDLKTSQYQKNSNEGWIKATAAVPFNIKRSQVRPTLLNVLKVMLSNYPDRDFIIVELGPDMEMAKEGVLVGRAVLENNSINIAYCIPSEEQIKEHNARIGKTEEIPELFSDKKHVVKNNDPKWFIPDEKTYQDSKRIYMMISYDKNRGSSLEDRYRKISSETGLSVQEVRNKYLYFSTFYYGVCADDGFSKEVITLKR